MKYWYNTVSWDGYQPSPTLQQGPVENGSITSSAVTIKAQNNPNAGSQGGHLFLGSGTGTTAGSVFIKAGNAIDFECDPNSITAYVNLHFLNTLVSPTINQTAPSSDVATTSLTISSQAPFAGASVNTIPGSLRLNVPGPVGGGANGHISIQDSQVTWLQLLNDQTNLQIQFQDVNQSPLISQASDATGSGTGKTLTIRAQNQTGTTSTGGALFLTSGTGTTIAGNIVIQTGGVTQMTATPTGMTLSSTPAALNNSTSVATTAYFDRVLLKPTVTWFHDDFINQAGASAVTAANTVNGDTPWGIVQVVGGTQTWSPVASTNVNMGQASMLTSATSGQGCTIYKISGVGNLAGVAGWEVVFIVKISTTSTICMRAGLFLRNGQASDPPTDGIYVEYDTANTGNTDSKFTWVTRSASTPNYSTTNAIAADTSFHTFRIRSTAAGTVLFSVDGGTEASVATDVPTVAVMPCLQILTRTSAGVTMTIDYFAGQFTTTRS